ncbi:hypothetical protein L7F22_017402 [Adiantum nelumboides]|nr:hypothetical protein [Adiantum nelumboides]
MKEGTSETVQDGVRASQPEDGSTPVIAHDEHTPQNDAIADEQFTKAAPMAAAEDQIMELSSNPDIDKLSSREVEQASRFEPTPEHINQQVIDDRVDNQVTDSVEGKDVEMTGSKNAEGDGGVSAGNCIQEAGLSEEMDIQEGNLIKTVIEVFEARHLVETRPIPVLVKGKEVDLVQLSFHVRACGGYDQVTLWSPISKSLGFGQECGPLLKLVYVKYLKNIENRRLIANQAVQGSQNVSKKENEAIVKPESVSSQSKIRGITSARKKSIEDGSTLDNSVIDHSAPLFAEGSESLAAVLEWVKRLALNPGDPRKGQGVRVSRWSEAWSGKCETLARRVREILYKKHEQPLYDLSPSESQDQELENKKRGRGRIKGSGKKARI